MEELTLQKFEEAAEKVKEVTLQTNLVYSEYFSSQVGNKVYLKPENMQYTGAYKVRGAYYKISTMSEEARKKGLITASAGNHAQGVAYAAKKFGVKAIVVMPTTTPLIKVNRTKGYGAEVILYGNVYDEACDYAIKMAEEKGYTFVHPFDDLDVATGQGSIAMEIIKELPPFCVDYFRGIEPRTSSRTRIAYAYDLTVFFDFLRRENPFFSKMDRKDIRLEYLDQITVSDLEEYMEYLKYRFNDNHQEITNKERGIMRKISSLKSFYNYFFRCEKLTTNPAALIQLPKLHEKEIIRLDIDEVALLLDEVEQGEQLTEKQKAFHNRTRIRDLALLTLLLGCLLYTSPSPRDA